MLAALDRVIVRFERNAAAIELPCHTDHPSREDCLHPARYSAVDEKSAASPCSIRRPEWTLFEIGSVTKTFTATVPAQMVLAGQVKLSDPVQKYLPDSVHIPAYRLGADGKPLGDKLAPD